MVQRYKENPVCAIPQKEYFAIGMAVRLAYSRLLNGSCCNGCSCLQTLS